MVVVWFQQLEDPLAGEEIVATRWDFTILLPMKGHRDEMDTEIRGVLHGYFLVLLDS